MPNSKFLEQYPLYRSFDYKSPGRLHEWAKVPINMECKTCRSPQTFNMVNEYHEHHETTAVQLDPANKVARLRYSCEHCKTFERHFFIKVSPQRDSIVKVGQFPAWEIDGNRALESMLQEGHKDNYKRGLICESQGFGIAAFAYYRRIVEEVIDRLLRDIAGLLSGSELQHYSEALEATKKTRITADKIELVKDLLPAILRPDDMNPLSTLHTVLSEGLHAESEAACLELADAVKKVLLFLTSQLETTAQASKEFTDGMRQILANKTAKNTKAKAAT